LLKIQLMQFQVPQFETENKLIGPFTIAQFAYIGSAAVISFLLFSVLTTWFWLIISALLVGGSLAMALGKVNGRSMPVFMSAMFSYLWGSKTLTIKGGFEQSVSASKTELATPPPLSVAPARSISSPPPAVLSPESAIAPELTGIPTANIGDSIAPVGAPIKRGGFAVSESEALAPAPTQLPVTPTGGITAKIISSGSIGEGLAPASPLQEAGFEKRRSRLQSLFNKITTTSSPIPFREESLSDVSSKGYAFIQKPTGETIAARRVDYR
jgi:hypothetical protein